MNVFYVQFLLSKKCNQSCSYCDLQHQYKNTKNTFEIDLDYFKWCINELGKHSKELMIEICGGEPGLIDNLYNVFEFLKSHPNVIKTQLMSNGLVRINQPNVINLVDQYNEHLIKNIVCGVIEKFYDIDYLKQSNTKTVIVLNKETTKSLLEYKEDLHELYDKRYFWLKAFVERSTKNDYIEDMLKVLDTNFYKERFNNPKMFDRKVCSKYSWLPCIDTEKKKIIHCAYHNFTNTIEYELTSENIEKLVNKNIFKSANPQYCDYCYGFSNSPMLLMTTPRINRTDNNT